MQVELLFTSTFVSHPSRLNRQCVYAGFPLRQN
nr:MAG TPA: hypothetical protein [Caudoviricetes sp.]